MNNTNNDDGTCVPPAPGRRDMSSQHEEGQKMAVEKDITHRKKLVPDGESSVLSREKLVTAREDAANQRESVSNKREDAVLMREGATWAREEESKVREEAATSREEKFRATNDVTQARMSRHVAILQKTNAKLVIASIEAIKLTEQAEADKAQLDHLAHFDVLTDLPNRVLLQDRLGQAIEAAHRQRRQLAVMFLDMDNFKHINDSLGHSIGDQLLQSIAQRLVACVRQSDTVSRQGGDEFVLLLPFIGHAKDAALSAQKILSALELPHHIDGNVLYSSVSIGISIYPDDGQDAETLIKCSDSAMYHVKESGRNNYKFFEHAMNARAVQRQSIEADLRGALERHEFVLHYQPKTNLLTGKIVGVEALIRWAHPKRGLLQPVEFVSIAEDCGLIVPIGRWVLREACLQAQAWQQAGLAPTMVAVNTSALELRAKGFLDNLRATLESTHLEPRYLEIELTESVLMRNADSTGPLLQAIADLGVKIAIDDFGTGYSSLSYLSRFPIDTLKIDQSFVKQITTNPADATIVIAVINMGKSLRQRVIAEGVETPEQHAFLLAQHCDEGQGYYFARPMVAAALATLLQTAEQNTSLTNHQTPYL